MQRRSRKQSLVDMLNRLYRDWVTPVCDPVKGFAALRGYDFYIKQWARYRKMQGAEPLLFETVILVFMIERYELTSTPTIFIRQHGRWKEYFILL
jgi:hypothetical protein